jgi:ABC-type ATPase involved in cell division
MNPFIKLQNIGIHYPTEDGDIWALRSIDLDIEKGENIFITGPSGAGKSTLFRIISLVEKPTQGAIYVANQDLRSIHQMSEASYRQQIALVPQYPMLLNDRSVLENLLLALQLTGMEIDECIERAENALRTVQLEKFKHSNPLTLSAGEQQRVSLARAISRQPKILLADEPSGNVDPELSKIIFDLLINMTEQNNTTVIISTHDLSLIQTIANTKNKKFRHIKLDKGNLQNDSFITPK